MIVTFFGAYIVCLKIIDKLSISYRVLRFNHAIENNDLEKVRSLLSKNPELINPVHGDFSMRYNLSLWSALKSGNDEMAEFLIDSGANVNQCDPDGISLLHLVPMHFDECKSYERSQKVVQILIRHGADVNAYDPVFLVSPLQLAISKGHPMYVEFLLKNGARLVGPEWDDHHHPMNILLTAPKAKQRGVLKLLIKYGLNVRSSGCRSTFDIDHLQLMIISAAAFDIDIVGIAEVLLDSGLPVNSVDPNGVTTLIMAIQLQNEELLSLLIARGADVNFNPTKGVIHPLIFASQFDNHNISGILLSNGADVNAKVSPTGETALHVACFCRHEDTITLLIRKGARISEENGKGRSPFSFLRPQEYDELDVPCTNAMIKEMSIEFFLNNSAVSEQDLDLLHYQPEVEELFHRCNSELARMSSAKFHSSHSYFSILIMTRRNDNFKKLARLTKNQQFVTKFKENLGKFSCYESDLERVFNEAIQARDRSARVIERLQKIFYAVLPELVILKLAENLEHEDIPLELN